MIRTLLSTAVAGVVAFSVAPVANAAETAPIDIRMTLDTPGMREYVDEDGTHWEGRGLFDFSVLLTDVGSENEEGVTMFLSVPPPPMDVQAWGDGWSCEDTEGGIACYHPDLVVPGEAWPELHFRAWPNDYIRDTIDVYATTGDYDPSHEGVHYFNDTST
jgi:hypothetical protein